MSIDRSAQKQPPVAIIGVAGIFAESHNAREYWANIVSKANCIREVPPSRWAVEDYYDPDPRARDKVYCKRGGFIPEIAFDPAAFGIPPNQLEVTDTSQLLGLVVARDLLVDAGYGEECGGRPFDRERTGVVLGVAGGQKLITPLTARLQYPIWERVLRSHGIPEDTVTEIVDGIKLAYPEWNENAFPGLLGNVIAGRIANRFDLGGLNSVIDAACASSLSALKMAVSLLTEGSADMMITGGVDTDNSPFTFMCFSKTPAFSPGDVPRPFDAGADGMMVGEGIGMVLLKRLEDAERDGDRVYAVIRGIGASSDGRFKSIYAPRPDGQALATRRAYEQADISPLSVKLLEAHGTGTKAGDPAEFSGLVQAFGSADGTGQTIALGSVKSQIGHTKAAAGVAGLMKATLALHHKLLPPTNNVEKPNPKLEIDKTPFYINTESRPWIQHEGEGPRRAGVSAFGFGGTNFHVVLEEYRSDHDGPYRLHPVAQPILLHASTTGELLAQCRQASEALRSSEGGEAYKSRAAASKALVVPSTDARLGFVAASVEEAAALLDQALGMFQAQPDAEVWEHPRGIWYRQSGFDWEGHLVALFPGQGAQYLGMGSDLAGNFPPMRELIGRMDELFCGEGARSLSSVLYPPPAFDEATLQVQETALLATDYAQAAIGVISAGMYSLLAQAGFQPSFTAGHSFGELSALWAGGMLSDVDFLSLVKARGKAMRPPVGSESNHEADSTTSKSQEDFDAGAMAAVQGLREGIEDVIGPFEGVVVANDNSNSQAVIAGPTPAVRAASEALKSKGYRATMLPVSAAFHTSSVSHASEPFSEAVARVEFHEARANVYSNTTGMPYPDDPEAAKELLAGHILKPVLFRTQIEAIYAAGGRIFVEFGPRRITTGLVEDILSGRPFAAIALNPSRTKSSDRQFREAVVQLRVLGVPLGDVDPYEVVD